MFRRLRAILDFLNVIEPGPVLRLSPTKIGMWAVIGIVLVLAISSPGNVAATLTALATAIPFIANYVHQRICDEKLGTDPNRFKNPPPPTPET